MDINASVAVASDVATKFKEKVHFNLVKFFESTVLPEITTIIMKDYENMLNRRVFGTNSKIRSTDYQEKFIKFLSGYPFVEKGIDDVSIVIPDIDDLTEDTGLGTLKFIMEGLYGDYIELTEEEYTILLNKPPDPSLAFNINDESSDPIFLYRKEDWIIGKAKHYNLDISNYSYSSLGIFNIFMEADIYTSDNIKNWIDTVIEKTLDEMSTK